MSAPNPTPDVSHVFVLGLPRTGTHLMRDIVRGSGQVRFGPEARFFGGATRFGVYSRPGLFDVFPAHDGSLSEHQSRRLLGDVFGGTSGPWRDIYWRRIAEAQHPEQFTEEFLATRRRAQDLFDLAMRVHARGAIPGDKTPSNLWRAENLLSWYPLARVVHMIRDPRASYTSMLSKGWVGPPRLGLPDTKMLRLALGSVSAIDIAAGWRRAMALDRALRLKYPDRYFSCRFEDLVRDPEPLVQSTADFLGLPVRSEMFEREVIASSYMQRGRPGFRAEAAEAWRSHLDPSLSKWMSRLTAEDLDEYGYSPN